MTRKTQKANEVEISLDPERSSPFEHARAIMHCLEYLAEEAKQEQFLYLREIILSASRCAADIAYGLEKESKDMERVQKPKGVQADGGN